jgi:predicted acylesterase/phospholipase RssA
MSRNPSTLRMHRNGLHRKPIQRGHCGSCSCSKAAVRSAPTRRVSIRRSAKPGSSRIGSSARRSASDWIIGTSIGAINASLIAGNEPANRLDRLEEFWRRMKRKELWGLANWPGLADTASYWSTLLAGIPGFFKPNPLAFLGAHYPLGRDSAGFYSTAPLAETLTELVDFALIARCTPRLTVGAAHVRTSKMRYFDSRETAITVEHVMASGALPPAFPAVRIDGELYWDGGILSNTPTEAIFDDDPRRDSLVFAVHMWNPMGPEPESIWEVLHRQKDIQPRRESYCETASGPQAAPRGLGARQMNARRRPQSPGRQGSGPVRLPHAHACRAAPRPSVGQ